MNEQTPLLAIRCATYNQVAFIRKCLDGFVKQKTTFPFVAIVHDDASTDGTADIIKEYAECYPNIIKAYIEIENQYSQGRLEQIMTSLIPKEVKYIAICEGDDYWVDPLKLQKQVDFLEQNSEYGMVYGKVRVWLQEDNRFGGSFGKKLRTFEELLRYNTIPTLTVVYRHVLDQQYVEEIEPSTKKWRMGDYPKWLYFSKKSDIGFIDEYFGVYRVNRVSASHFADRVGHLKFQINALEIALYMCDKFGEEKHLTEIRLLWSNLEYSYLISDKELLENTQRDIARASLWPLSFRMIILKLFYKHPEMYLKSKMITKKMLHIKL